jgi:mxaJ protein
MSLVFSVISKRACLLLSLVGICNNFVNALGQAAETKRILRIAADPNNLPFSNQHLEGFEDKLAQLVARELGVELQYVWRAQRRGFFRETLKSGDCDLVLGVPSRFERALTTKPYYRSAYVFVSRKDADHQFRSLDDPVLRQVKVGIQLVGDDGANTPPAHALANRGVITNVVGFTLYGDYRQENPPARIIRAVVEREVEVAIVWGPLAGFFAQKEASLLKIMPISPEENSSDLPFVFDIAMGVRKSDRELRDRLDEVITRKHDEIEKILDDYAIPRVHEKGDSGQREIRQSHE